MTTTATTSLEHEAPGGLRRLGYLALAVACVAVFLTALDQTVVVTSLVSMMSSINLPVTEPDRAAWIVNGYLLGYVIAMPLLGRVADVFGRWRVFAVCLGIFAVGSLLCALTPDLTSSLVPDTDTFGGLLLSPFYSLVQWVLGLLGNTPVDVSNPGLAVLVAARFVQAAGGGALVPVAMAIVGDLYGPRGRGIALGLIGAVTEAGGVLGPVWGAFVTQRLGWQWIFTLNLPVVALLLVAGFFAVPRANRVREPVDVLGAVLFGAALACLAVGLGQETGAAGALSLTTRNEPNVPLLVAALVLLAVFVAVELRMRYPVLDLRLFRRRAFSAAAVLSLLVGVALIVALVEVPLYVATLVDSDPVTAGLALLRMTAFIPIGALAGGWLSSRLGCPPTAVAGVALTALGLFLMHLWPMQVDWTLVTAATVSAGLGFGLVIAPISTSALNASPRAQSGSAASVVTVLRMTGMILGLAGIAAWGLNQFRTLMAQIVIGDQHYTAAEAAAQFEKQSEMVLHEVYGDIFLLAAVLTLVGVIPALLLWRRSGRDAAATAEGEYESFVAPLV